MNYFAAKIICLISSAVLVGCGGSAGCDAAGIAFGGGVSSGCSKSNSNSTPSVAKGYFIDSPVEGVRYKSGAQSGVTGADGSFIYEEGASIEFYLGGLRLGSVSNATKYVTPIDLVSGGSISDDAVINIAALLLSLDSNQNFSDGIKISSPTQLAAASWGASQIDFKQSYALFSAQAVALTGAALPSKEYVISHLTTSFRCLHSGVFVGSWTEVGSAGGIGGYFVNPSDGGVSGAYVANDQSSSGVLAGTQGISMDQRREFVSGNTSSGAKFSGVLSRDGGDLAGTWSNSSRLTSGGFTGRRLDNSYDGVKYRISGFVQMSAPDFLLYNINVYSSGKANGKFYGMRNNVTRDLSGSLAGARLSVSTNFGETFVANINLTTGALSGSTWSGGLLTGTQVRSDLGGCMLNGFGV
jgi:hypothetical protein